MVGIEGADSVRAVVTPEVPGVYLFRLTVTDDQGMSDSDEVRLIVMPGRSGGTIRIVGAPVVREVVRVGYAIVAVDMDTLRGELVLTEDRVARKTVLEVKAGERRLVELYGYDRDERVITFGSALVSVEEGRIVEVEIEMRRLLPPTGEIEVEAVFEEGEG